MNFDTMSLPGEKPTSPPDPPLKLRSYLDVAILRNPNHNMTNRELWPSYFKCASTKEVMIPLAIQCMNSFGILPLTQLLLSSPMSSPDNSTPVKTLNSYLPCHSF